MLDLMDERTANTGDAEPTDESPRIRMIVDTTETIRKAVELRASKESVRKRRKVPNYEVVSDILRESLADEIREVEAWSAAPPPTEPPKPRRKKE